MHTAGTQAQPCKAAGVLGMPNTGQQHTRRLAAHLPHLRGPQGVLLRENRPSEEAACCMIVSQSRSDTQINGKPRRGCPDAGVSSAAEGGVRGLWGAASGLGPRCDAVTDICAGMAWCTPSRSLPRSQVPGFETVSPCHQRPLRPWVNQAGHACPAFATS